MRRRVSTQSLNIWPGFVDALATLLLVIIFVLLVFTVSQYTLSSTLSGRNKALEELNIQISELGDMLALEKQSRALIQAEFDNLFTSFQDLQQEKDKVEEKLDDLEKDRINLLGKIASLADERDALLEAKAKEDAVIEGLEQQVASLAQENKTLQENQANVDKIEKELADAYKVIDANKEKVQTTLQELAVLKGLRDELLKRVEKLEQSLSEKDTELAKKDEKIGSTTALNEEAQKKIAILNAQMASLRQKIASLNEALDAAEAEAKAKDVQIENLGKRLNLALADKVQELARYRSDFFGRLRKVLGDRANVRIEGDRFVFQSEVLFDSGSSDMGFEGQAQLVALADTIKEIMKEIPPDIDWILRIDGHTDNVPVTSFRFRSNWELSTFRALSVVHFLIEQGIPENRLAAAGFGEFHPLVEGDTADARRKNRRIEFKLTGR